MRDFFFRVGGGGGRGRGVGLVGARGVVVAAARGVGEGVVGVVYLLEFLGARGALRGVGGDAVRVGFQGLSFGVGLGEVLGRFIRLVRERERRTFCMHRGFAAGWPWGRLRGWHLFKGQRGFEELARSELLRTVVWEVFYMRVSWHVCGT